MTSSSPENTAPFDISGLSKEDAIGKIASEISRLEAQIYSLRSLHNTLSPMSKLPPDVLSKVFMDCAGFDERGRLSGTPICDLRVPDVRPIVSWVSRHWRDVALECKPLWHVITNWNRCSNLRDRDYARTCIQRSGDHNLHVDLLLPDPQLMSTILSSRPRIEVFSLTFESTTSPGQTSHVLRPFWKPQPAPLLQSLKLVWVPDLDKMIASCSFPKLQTLVLHSCSFTCASLTTPAPNLTKIQFYNAVQMIDIADFLNLLASLPSLATCITENSLNWHSYPPQIPLPQLETLHITESINSTHRLLHVLNTPHASVAITRSSKEAGPNLGFVETVCRALQASQDHVWGDIHHVVDRNLTISVYNATNLGNTLLIPGDPDFDFALFVCLRSNLGKLKSLITSSPSRLAWKNLSVLQTLEKVTIESTPSLAAFIDFLHPGIHDSTVDYSSLFPALRELILQDWSNDPELLDKLYEILVARSIRGIGLKKIVFLKEIPAMFHMVQLRKVVREVDFSGESRLG